MLHFIWVFSVCKSTCLGVSSHSIQRILFVCLFCCFTSQVNSYGHGGTVSSPNHTFSWAGLNKRLTSNSCTYFRLKLTTILLEWISGREENDRRNYFMICSQTRICSQTHYRLHYADIISAIQWWWSSYIWMKLCQELLRWDCIDVQAQLSIHTSDRWQSKTFLIAANPVWFTGYNVISTKTCPDPEGGGGGGQGVWTPPPPPEKSQKYRVS